MVRIGFCLLAWFAIASVAAGAASAARRGDAVKELQQKRAAVLAEALKLTQKAFEGGHVAFKQVIDVQEQLLAARLDLAETKEQRLQVHQEMVKAAEQTLEMVNKLVAAQQASRIDQLQAEAHLLAAKIGFEKAKAAKE